MPRINGTYNKIFSEEKWKLVNKENKAIMDDFLTEYKQQKKSIGTINAYFNDMKIVSANPLL